MRPRGGTTARRPVPAASVRDRRPGDERRGSTPDGADPLRSSRQPAAGEGASGEVEGADSLTGWAPFPRRARRRFPAGSVSPRDFSSSTLQPSRSAARHAFDASASASANSLRRSSTIDAFVTRSRTDAMRESSSSRARCSAASGLNVGALMTHNPSLPRTLTARLHPGEPYGVTGQADAQHPRCPSRGLTARRGRGQSLGETPGPRPQRRTGPATGFQAPAGVSDGASYTIRCPDRGFPLPCGVDGPRESGSLRWAKGGVVGG